MRILVRILERKPIKLGVAAEDTVESLKAKVQNFEGIPVELQRLLHDGKELQDGHSLGDYQIQKDSMVELVQKPRGCAGPSGVAMEAQVFVRDMIGRRLAVEVDLERDTVLDVKKELEKRNKIPPGVQRLIYAGKRLEDGRLLKDYGIVKHATLHMVWRLRGCGCGCRGRNQC